MPAVRHNSKPTSTPAAPGPDDSWVHEAHQLIWKETQRKRNKPYEVVHNPGQEHRLAHENAVVPEFSLEPSPSLKRPVNRRPPPLSLRDLECIGTLGKGTFARVILVRTTRKEHALDQHGTLLAMKVIKRKRIRNMKQHFADSQRERKILTGLPWNPFICGIVQTFSDSLCVYTMFELVPCGNFRKMIQKHAPMDATTAAFYYINIACGLEFLGKYGVIHSDLKPENILIGEDGYLYLTDFNGSFMTNEKWETQGSPVYQAPECLEPKKFIGRHGSSMDWWASGCILYEMLTRKLPFIGSTSLSTLRRTIISGYSWPPNVKVEKNLKAFISGLFEVAPERRLGSNIQDIRTHPWLENVNWDKIQQRQYIPPLDAPKSTVLKELWHCLPLPHQREVPGITVIQPSIHLAHDNRFPPKAIV